MNDNDVIVSYINLFCEWMKIKPSRMADYFETFAYLAARSVNSQMQISRDDRASEALLSMLGRLDFQSISQDYPNRERESLVKMGIELYKRDFISRQDIAIIESKAKETFLDKITYLQQKQLTIPKENMDLRKEAWQKCIGFAPCDVWNWLANNNIQHEKILYLRRYAHIFKSQAPLNNSQAKYFDTLQNSHQPNILHMKEHQPAIEKLLRKIARTTSYYLEYKESIFQQPVDCDTSYNYKKLSQSFQQREEILLFCSLIQLWATRSDIFNDRHRDSGLTIRGIAIMCMFYLLQTKQIVFSIHSNNFSSQEYKILPLQENFLGFLCFYGEKGPFRKRKMIASMVKDFPTEQIYRQNLIINIYDHEDNSNPGRMTKKYEPIFNYTFLMAEKALCSKDINKIQGMFGKFVS